MDRELFIAICNWIIVLSLTGIPIIIVYTWYAIRRDDRKWKKSRQKANEWYEREMEKERKPKS